MESRRKLYVAGFVGASVSYIFNVLAFTRQFDVIRFWKCIRVRYSAVLKSFDSDKNWVLNTGR